MPKSPLEARGQTPSLSSSIMRRRRNFRLKNFKRKESIEKDKKISKQEITELVNSYWERDFIKAKMKKFMDYLMKIDLKSSLHKHKSYQDYLKLITHSHLPKYNRLNGLPLGASLKQSKIIFDEICEEIEKFYKELESQEKAILGLVKAHRKNLDLRKEVGKRLHYALEDKKLREKNFKNSEKEVKWALDGMKNGGKYQEQPEDFRKLLKWRMYKYKDDWKKFEHHEVGNFRRKKNRMQLYQSLELERKKLEEMYR